MITKSFCTVNGKRVARIRFVLQSCLWAGTVHLVGDLDNWNRKAHPFARDDSGNWSITIDLPEGRQYQFRYLCDDTRWINDPQADGYVRTIHGDENFIVNTEVSAS